MVLAWDSKPSFQRTQGTAGSTWHVALTVSVHEAHVLVLGVLLAEVRLAELALDTETPSEAGVSAAQVQVGMASGGGHPFCAMESAPADLLATCAWPRFAAVRDLVDQTLDPAGRGASFPSMPTVICWHP